jgi:hypothetical protein
MIAEDISMTKRSGLAAFQTRNIREVVSNEHKANFYQDRCGSACGGSGGCA